MIDPFLFIRSVCIVFKIIDINKIDSLHRGDQNNPGIGIEVAQFVDNNSEGTIDGRIAGVVLIIAPLTHRPAGPPIIGTQKQNRHLP